MKYVLAALAGGLGLVVLVALFKGLSILWSVIGDVNADSYKEIYLTCDTPQRQRMAMQTEQGSELQQ